MCLMLLEGILYRHLYKKSDVLSFAWTDDCGGGEFSGKNGDRLSPLLEGVPRFNFWGVYPTWGLVGSLQKGPSFFTAFVRA